MKLHISGKRPPHYTRKINGSEIKGKMQWAEFVAKKMGFFCGPYPLCKRRQVFLKREERRLQRGWSWGVEFEVTSTAKRGPNIVWSPHHGHKMIACTLRWHQAKWCPLCAWGKRCHPWGSLQAWGVSLSKCYEVERGQGQGPAPGSVQAPVSIQNGELMDWEQPHGEELGSTGEWKGAHDQSMWACSSESQLYLGLHPKQHGQHGPLPCSAEAPPLVLNPALGSQHRKDLLEQVQNRVIIIVRELKVFSSDKRLECLCCSAWSREGLEEILWLFNT